MPNSAGFLSPYRVLDLTDHRGLLAGRLLAQLGADVIQVEPTGGSSARRVGPFDDTAPDDLKSMYWAAYASCKRGVTCDLDTEAGMALFLRLVARSDFLIESEPPGAMAARGLDRETLRAANPALIHVSITPFGSDGPKANWADSDLVLWAAGGPLLQAQDGDRPPLRISVPQAYLHAVGDAAGGALVAHFARVASGRGQHVDISVQQSVAQATLSSILAAAVGHENFSIRVEPKSRTKKTLDLSGSGARTRRSKWQVRDGLVEMHLAMGPAAGRFTNNLTAWMRDEGALDAEIAGWDWVTIPARIEADEITEDDLERVRGIVGGFLAKFTKAELAQIAMQRKLLMAPVATTEDLANSTHHGARGFFQTVEDSAGRRIRLPGDFAMGVPEAFVPVTAAPLPGQHDEAVWCGLVGLSAGELAALRAQGVVRPASGDACAPGDPSRPGPSDRGFVDAPGAPGARAVAETGHADAGERLPLAGLKVLDLAWVVAGPVIGRMLADYGATVVRVESSQRVDTTRVMGPFPGGKIDTQQSALFENCNAGKLGMTLDLASPGGQQVARDLAKWADVVVESFSPGQMKRWGLGYETLRESNPGLVMLSTSLMGQTGPYASFAGFGNIGAAMAGFQQLVGWPGELPIGPYGPYTDYVGPRCGIVALLSALDHRRRTGEGCHLDISQAEAGMQFLAPQIADYSVTGRVAEHVGNRDPQMAPHGVFLCLGTAPAGAVARDRLTGGAEAIAKPEPSAEFPSWVAIAVRSDAEWRACAALIGGEELAGDPRFATLEARKANEDALESIVANWTATRGADEIVESLQWLGVPAHVAASGLDMVEDPQLVARGHFVALEHPRMGISTIETTRYRLSDTPGGPVRCGPTPGRDNELVLRELLGYGDDEIASLRDAGVLR